MAPTPGACLNAVAPSISPAPAGDPASQDDLAKRLIATPAAGLLDGPAGRFDSPALQQTALSFAAETAALMTALRSRMAVRQGYALPPDGGFSLAAVAFGRCRAAGLGPALCPGVDRVLPGQRPVLPGVNGDQLAREGRYQARPWRGAALRFVAQRRLTLAALARCDAEVLRRPVVFGGNLCTAAEMRAAMLAHDHEHRVEMAALWPPANA